MNLKRDVIALARKARLVEALDFGRFVYLLARARIGSWKAGPGSVRPALPPADIAYDAYGSLDAEGYWRSGVALAEHFAGLIRKHVSRGRVLEWGCGPARIIRHMPALLGKNCEIHGADFNEKTIRWCAANFPAISFVCNGLRPPLPYVDGSFDSVYAFSVFTHLSEELHFSWIAELARVLKPGGVVLLTLHGDACRSRLTGRELQNYSKGELVVRAGASEGKRTFLAYHPPQFAKDRLLRELEIVEWQPAPSPVIEFQDLWVARKP